MKKKIIALFAFLLLCSCGYSPIYSGKNFNFNILKVSKKENNKISSRIKRDLLNLSNDASENLLTLTFDSQKKITVISKDTKGNPSRYEMTIIIDLQVEYGDGKKDNRSFSANFNYKADSNKFSLSLYEKEIEELLINKIIEDCTIFLSRI
jgi:hypothetical protein